MSSPSLNFYPKTMTIKVRGTPSKELCIDLYSCAKRIFCGREQMAYEFPFMVKTEPREVSFDVIAETSIMSEWSSHPEGMRELSGGWKWRDEESKEIAIKALCMWEKDNEGNSPAKPIR